MKRKNPLKIGITVGDPAGVGPEVALKGASAFLHDETVLPVLLGREKVLRSLNGDLCENLLTVAPEDIEVSSFSSSLLLCEPPGDFPLPVAGRGSVETGAEALATIDFAIDLWKRNIIDAIVTAPVHKGFIEKTGIPFTGHTEYFAEQIGESEPLMMMFSPRYRVLLVTTHHPVSRVEELITHEWMLSVIRQGYSAIEAIDGSPVRLAITGLDPHCGDDGAIGTFDRDVTEKVVAAALSEGIPIEGPFAADTLFLPSKWEKYNLIIVQYHDQGLIPFKMAAFDEGVNVTLGLSLVRTSVDHGTAYDIAGKGLAGHRSMVEAIKVAAMLAKKKNEGRL